MENGRTYLMKVILRKRVGTLTRSGAPVHWASDAHTVAREVQLAAQQCTQGRVP